MALWFALCAVVLAVTSCYILAMSKPWYVDGLSLDHGKRGWVYTRLFPSKDIAPNGLSSQPFRQPSARHNVPRGIYGLAGNHIRVPLMTGAEFWELPWSQETSIRQSSTGQILLHNYTIYADQDGKMRTRWLKREFVSLPKNGTPLIDKRGYGVRHGFVNNGGDYALPWPSSSPQCPAFVTLYYETDADRVALDDLVRNGVNIWHTKLKIENGRSGVKFRIPPNPLCTPLAVDYRVHVTANSGRIRKATTGHRASLRGGERGFHRLWFDPRLDFSPAEPFLTPIGDMMHELGHILGLAHEHQRPDVRSYIDFDCKAMDGYSDLVKWWKMPGNWPPLNPYKPGEPEIELDADVCQDPRIAAWFLKGAVDDMGIPYDFPEFNAYWYLPHPPNQADAVTLGPFNLNSVMIYSSFSSGDGQSRPMIVQATNGGDIPYGTEPNDLDVAAVKMIYPDLVPPSTPS